MHFRRGVRETWRQWRRQPGATALAVLTLALAVGANATFFALLDVVALRPVNVPRADRLVSISALDSQGQQSGIVPAMLEQLSARQRAFDGLAGYLGSGAMLVESTGRAAVEASPAFVSGDYFAVLGVEPFAGRLLTASDSTASAPRVVVLGHDFWKAHFNASPGVIGSTLTVDGVPFTIVGVTARGFRGMQVERVTDITLPAFAFNAILGVPDGYGPPPMSDALGRLRDGVGVDEARSHVEAIWRDALAAAGSPARQIGGTDAATLRPRVISASTGFSFLRPRFTSLLTLLNALAICVIVIGCVNVAGLLVARSMARRHEVRVKMALGASRRHIAVQSLIESACLCLLGSGMGLVLSIWSVRPLFLLLWPGADASGVSIALTSSAIWIAVGVAGIMTAIVGAAPAWLSSQTTAVAVPPMRTVARSQSRLERRLLVAQLALALVLIAGAGLFTRTLVDLRTTDVGFNTEGLTLFSLRPQPGGYADMQDLSYYPDLLSRLSAIPGVSSAALTKFAPFRDSQQLVRERIVTRRGVERSAALQIVSPGFFRTLEVPIVQGGDFSWSDRDSAVPSAIVSQSLASRLFLPGEAVGQTVQIGEGSRARTARIIGVAADSAYQDGRRQAAETVFLSLAQDQSMRWSLVITRDAASAPSINAVRRQIETLGREYVPRATTFARQLDDAFVRERLAGAVGLLFGLLAVLLAGIGVYALLAQGVARRSREFGVRLALGAAPGVLRRSVVAQSVRLVLAGIVIGVPAALMAARWAASRLPDFRLTEPAPIVIAPLVLLTVAVAAAYGPARRASRIDPIASLRQE